jgi:cytosine/adenosine deaminase-related metal-dependent hydrolase
MNDAWDIVHGDVYVDDGRIAAIGGAPAAARPDSTIDARGGLLLPGFVQTHIHLCQTLFRGLAEDLPLLEWLRRRIWPLEAAHDDHTLGVAARLAAAELLLGGTTSVLTMETVHGTAAVFDALAPTGIRATIGKCLMDVRGEAPDRLHQPAQAGVDETLSLQKKWQRAVNGRLRAALAPRFALSCTRELLEASAAASAAHDLLVHTHASEQRDEIALVRAQTGLENVAYFASVGLATHRLCTAHCVWVTDAEQQLLAEHRVKVLHCPGSNLKLGSGIAPVPEMRARGIGVSIGADGAACNNALDMFHEMRLAASLQAMRLGPGALPARDVVAMATREGARALGLERDIGSIEPGKKADMILVDTGEPHQAPGPDPYARLVFACRPSDVRVTMVDGAVIARDGQLAWGDRAAIAHEATEAARLLVERAGI